MQFLDFVHNFCGGQLRLPLNKACRLAGVNAQSIRNARSDRRRTAVLPVLKVAGHLYINAADIYQFLGGQAAFPPPPSSPPPEKKEPTPRRGAPSKVERAEAARRGLTVSALRKRLAAELAGEARP